MITADRIIALKPCWPTASVKALVGDGVRPGAALGLLLGISPGDARWILSRLLNRQARLSWAKGCALRAQGYAAYAAAAAAAYAEEHKLACVLGLELLAEQERGS